MREERGIHARLATDPGKPTTPNEDWAGAATSTVVVLDGVTVPTDLGTGCTHGTPWYVHNLGTHLLAAADTELDTPLPGLLARAITAVAELHRDTCDLAHIGSPSAAVAILRDTGTALDYLILADVSIVLEGQDGISVLTDTRVEETRKQLGGGMIGQHRSRFRNKPGGYWVAEASPAAADHALTGTLARDRVHRAAVLTDGAASIVDLYQVMDWPTALDLMDSNGPEALIERVRQTERGDPEMRRWPRFKPGDDATAVCCRFS